MNDNTYVPDLLVDDEDAPPPGQHNAAVWTERGQEPFDPADTVVVVQINANDGWLFRKRCPNTTPEQAAAALAAWEVDLLDQWAGHVPDPNTNLGYNGRCIACGRRIWTTADALPQPDEVDDQQRLDDVINTMSIYTIEPFIIDEIPW